MSNEQSITKPASGSPERIQQRPVMAPPTDVYETRDELLVVADVPGARKDSINVRLEKQELTIYAARDNDWKGDVLAGRPRSADWSRSFLVPRGIDAEKITAELKDGVLTVHLPKSEAVKPRQIAVRAG